jgi:glutaconate CoA-transferase subunit A
VESGKVFVREETESSLILGVKAGALDLPLLASKDLHSDIVKLHPEWKRFKSPLTGEDLLAMPPIIPDYALLHMPRADENGNIQSEDMFIYNKIFATWDHLISQAAREVIVSVEEIVDTQKLREHPEQTFIPFYDVDGVAHVPQGSHPCELLGHYPVDQKHVQFYLEFSKEDESFHQYLDKFIYGVSDNDEYLKVVCSSK